MWYVRACGCVGVSVRMCACERLRKVTETGKQSRSWTTALMCSSMLRVDPRIMRGYFHSFQQLLTFFLTPLLKFVRFKRPHFFIYFYFFFWPWFWNLVWIKQLSNEWTSRNSKTLWLNWSGVNKTITASLPNLTQHCVVYFSWSVTATHASVSAEDDVRFRRASRSLVTA